MIDLDPFIAKALRELAPLSIRGDYHARASEDGLRIFVQFVPAIGLDSSVRGAETEGLRRLRYALVDAGHHADDPGGIVRVQVRAPLPADLDAALEQHATESLDALADGPPGGSADAKRRPPAAPPLPQTWAEQRDELAALFARRIDFASCLRIEAIVRIANEQLRERAARALETRDLPRWGARVRAALASRASRKAAA
jgi:hypothetical protein